MLKIIFEKWDEEILKNNYFLWAILFSKIKIGGSAHILQLFHSHITNHISVMEEFPRFLIWCLYLSCVNSSIKSFWYLLVTQPSCYLEIPLIVLKKNTLQHLSQCFSHHR